PPSLHDALPIFLRLARRLAAAAPSPGAPAVVNRGTGERRVAMERVHRRWGAVAMAALLAMGSRWVRAEDVPLEELRRELHDLQGQLEKLQGQIKKQQQVIDKLSAEQPKAPPPPATPSGSTAAD